MVITRLKRRKRQAHIQETDIFRGKKRGLVRVVEECSWSKFWGKGENKSERSGVEECPMGLLAPIQKVWFENSIMDGTKIN